MRRASTSLGFSCARRYWRRGHPAGSAGPPREPRRPPATRLPGDQRGASGQLPHPPRPRRAADGRRRTRPTDPARAATMGRRQRGPERCQSPARVSHGCRLAWSGSPDSCPPGADLTTRQESGRACSTRALGSDGSSWDCPAVRPSDPRASCDSAGRCRGRSGSPRSPGWTTRRLWDDYSAGGFWSSVDSRATPSSRSRVRACFRCHCSCGLAGACRPSSACAAQRSKQPSLDFPADSQHLVGHSREGRGSSLVEEEAC